MISYLKGKVIHKDIKYIVLNASGVGYKINLTIEDASKISSEGKEVELWTHLAIRENAHDLYGFTNKKTLDFFELLITISGIGPKSALAILNLADPSVIKKAVISGDSSYLTKVSGIGRKTAQKIIVDLKEKLGSGEEAYAIQEDIDVVEALKSLGYSQLESREVLNKLPKNLSGTAEKVKSALKLLGK